MRTNDEGQKTASENANQTDQAEDRGFNDDHDGEEFLAFILRKLVQFKQASSRKVHPLEANQTNLSVDCGFGDNHDKKAFYDCSIWCRFF